MMQLTVQPEVKTLTTLVRAADGRPVVIVSIPFKRDLQNLQERGTPPLPAWFDQMAKELGFTYVDLLPILAANPADWSGYYHACDHHWTAKANAIVAKALAPVIERALAKARQGSRATAD
jgi:hypothetical protein